MKKIIILTLLFAFAMGELYAQPAKRKRNDYDEYMEYPKNEIYVQYGSPSIFDFSYFMSDKKVTNNGNTFTSDNRHFYGIAGAGYNRYITPYFNAGAYIGFSTSDMDVMNDTGNKLFRSSLYDYTVMASGHWIFFKEGATELSAGLYIGATYLDETISGYNGTDKSFTPVESDRFRVAYHLTAIKARFGGNIGGFVELGFGYRGLVNAGLSVRF